MCVALDDSMEDVLSLDDTVSLIQTGVAVAVAGRDKFSPHAQDIRKVASGNEPKSDDVLLQTDKSQERMREGPKTIKQIFQDTGTDKLFLHGYHRYYETQLAPYRDIDGLRLLEIGAKEGKSLGAWLQYFKNPAAVQGVSYGANATEAKENACNSMPEHCQKLEIYSLDQSDKAALADMKAKNPEGWDIIIDDASHYPPHQIISFQSLWPSIRPGGLYVVEDIESSYAEKGAYAYNYPLHGGIGRAPPSNAVEQFKRLVDVVSRKHFGQPQFTVFDGVDQDVADVDFADGLIFVHKAPANPEWDTFPRDTMFDRGLWHNDHFQEYQKKLQSEQLEKKLLTDPYNVN